MKRITKYLASLILVIFVMPACEEKTDWSLYKNPEILFMTEDLVVDLNLSTNPAIVCVINSEAGLKSVSQYIVKANGIEEEYEKTVTSFFNPNSYSIMQTPVYNEDMVEYKIVATDLGGRKQEKSLPFKITTLRDAPIVKYNDNIEAITYTEGTMMPKIVISMSSEEDLRYAVLSEVVNRTESKIQINGTDTLKFSKGVQSYSIDMQEDGYQFKIGQTALKILVAAGEDMDRLKLKVATLKVNYIEKQGPIISFIDGTELLNVDEFADATVEGNITSVNGLVHIACYKTTQSGSIKIAEKEFDAPIESYDFLYDIPAISMDVTGVLIEAKDNIGKITKATKTFNVKELAPAPSIHLDQEESYFNGLDVNTSIIITGSITSSSGLKTVTSYLIKRDGNTSSEQKSITDINKFTINLPLSATADLAGVRIVATDINGKTSEIKYTIHIGYYYYETMMSLDGAGTKTTSDTGPTPGCFFSAKNGRAYEYCDAKENWQDIDVAFMSFSSNSAIRMVNMGNTSTKLTGHKHGCGKETWTSSTKSPIGLAAGITRDNFDKVGITEIETLTVPEYAPDQYVQIAEGGLTNGTENVAVYTTMINEIVKTVIVTYGTFVEQTTEASSSKFIIKVKVQK